MTNERPDTDHLDQSERELACDQTNTKVNVAKQNWFRGLGGAGALLVSQVLRPAGRVAARRDINARRPWEAVRQSETVFTESRPIGAEG